MKRNPLKQSTLLIIVVAALIAVSIGSMIWTLLSMERQISRRVGTSLQAVLDTTQEALRIWREETITNISIIANSRELRQSIDAQLRSRGGRSQLLLNPALGRIRAMMEPYVKGHGYIDFSIVATDGVQVASGSDDLLGTDSLAKLDPATFAQAFAGTAALGAPLRLKSSSPAAESVEINLIVAAPVPDDSGKAIAALIFRLDPAKEFGAVTRLGRLGRTGETLVFDKEAHLLTPSRFEGDLSRLLPRNRSLTFSRLADPGVNTTEGLRPALPREQQPLTRMAAAATRGESGMDLDGYRDYRGVPVAGAWSWDEELRLGLATEMDLSEANAPVQTIWNLSLVMSAAITIAVILLLRLVAHRGRLLATNVGYQQALKARQDLLGIVAHDLKNPINSIALSSAMLLQRQGHPEMDTNFAATSLGAIHRAAFRMNRLIEDLLLSTRIYAGQLRIRPEECDLRMFLHEFEQQVLPLTLEKSIKLTYTLASSVHKVFADPDRLAQILSNLIGNAIKFSPACGVVSLSVSRRDDEIEFRIRDCGPGIPTAELPHVFDQYWQAQHGKPGAGLGLYICNGLVQAHGGRIWIESTVGEGTTVGFTLPAVKDAVADHDVQWAS